jgi:hypothetical protein
MKHVLICICLLAVLLACKKEKIETPLVSKDLGPATAYFPLKKGNYWIYEVDVRDLTTQAIVNTYIDSVYVNDTLRTSTNKLVYDVKSSSGLFFPGIYYDSLGSWMKGGRTYLRTPLTSFDTLNTTKINLNPTEYITMYTQMIQSINGTSCVKGICYTDFISTQVYAAMSSAACTNTMVNGVIHAKNTGIVYGQYSFSSTFCAQRMEYSLIRKNVQP